MKFFVSLSFFLFITDTFSQSTPPHFENDSTYKVKGGVVDIYTTDSATMAANWILFNKMSEDFLNAYEDSLKMVEEARIAYRDSMRLATTSAETDSIHQNNTSAFSQSADTLKPIYKPQPSYSPCNVLYDVNLVTQKGVEINYSCSDHILTAYVYDYNTFETGKVKWEIDLKKLGNPYMNKIEFSGEEKFDLVIELIDETRYLVNSKNGRVKGVE